MQSQKSLANATKSVVKLMKVHDHTSTWAMADVNPNATARGSANFLNTRLVTNNPVNFKQAVTQSQFGVTLSKGSHKATSDLHNVKSRISLQKKESTFLNQQRQLLYLKTQSSGIGGGSKAVTALMRP